MVEWGRKYRWVCGVVGIVKVNWGCGWRIVEVYKWFSPGVSQGHPPLLLYHLSCYDPASSLRKRNDVQGKGWLDFNSLDLTKGVARADSEDNVSGAGAGGSKGESVTTTAEAGAEDTSSDGYR